MAAELLAFSDCISAGREPEPSGQEGLLDVRVIEALIQSARRGKPVRLKPAHKARRPSRKQERRAPPIRREPPLVHASPPRH